MVRQRAWVPVAEVLVPQDQVPSVPSQLDLVGQLDLPVKPVSSQGSSVPCLDGTGSQVVLSFWFQRVPVMLGVVDPGTVPGVSAGR